MESTGNETLKYIVQIPILIMFQIYFVTHLCCVFCYLRNKHLPQTLTLDHVSPATRLLEKRRQMFEVITLHIVLLFSFFFGGERERVLVVNININAGSRGT